MHPTIVRARVPGRVFRGWARSGKVAGMPACVVSVINYKGGVGKTTLTANLGADLAARGRRVLLVDLDPQASLTFSCYRAEEWEEQLADGRTVLQWFESFLAGGVAEPLTKAGFQVILRVLREPLGEEKLSRAYLVARKPR